ncbi:hypothetical protein GCM10007860_14960 [Chitiniphilus shinanonensis]|uniref:DUF3149 domain-containing protein n=1 Tax=Chitiniphilus shinanonensis TaxID=553088 RepID=A0ABQ6BRR3_9NEIS|nr:DUF3149 domain-containing protein [Chitiniphilus shinanonensis]GLS04349.1 hypothetical protein GCM10007860_14960 [Chitiniphilus shinanonensis]
MENTPFQTLFMSDIGLLSLFTIGFVVAMAVFIFCYARRAIRRDTLAHQQEEQQAAEHSGHAPAP